MVPLDELGEFSDTGHMTSNASAYQALQFGTVDGHIFSEFYVTAERNKYFAYATPFYEERFCMIMSSSAAYRYDEVADNLFWLQPFVAHVWVMFIISLFLIICATDGVMKKKKQQQLREVL
jgi:hypothetical protein